MGEGVPLVSDEVAFSRTVDTLRDHDRDAYLTTLFMPAGTRPYVAALYAFGAEIARVPETVSDPMLGEIRIQWWRDAITEDLAGGNPVAIALLETIRKFGLPRDAFGRMLDARIFDLYDDPMPSMNDLEGYAGDTMSSLIQMVAIVLAGGRDPGTADVAGHAGVAQTITTMLRQVPRNLHRIQALVPRSLMEARGLEAAALREGRDVAMLAPVLAELRRAALQHDHAARAGLSGVDASVKAAFLPLALASAYLSRMEKQADQPLATVDLAPWRRQWILWRASRVM